MRPMKGVFSTRSQYKSGENLSGNFASFDTIRTVKMSRLATGISAIITAIIMIDRSDSF